VSDRDRFSVKEGTQIRWDVYWLRILVIGSSEHVCPLLVRQGITMTKTIAELNDRFRRGDNTFGQWMMVCKHCQRIAGAARPTGAKLRQLHLDSDIHGERDFGEVALDGENYFENRILRPHLTHYSADPASPNATRR